MRLIGAGALQALLNPIKRVVRSRPQNIKKTIPEISDSEVELIQRYQKYTMTSLERQWALISALKYINRGKIEGAIVECGVWRGGNMLIAKDMCRSSGIQRDIYLFDTFAGMSEPTDNDISISNSPAGPEYETRKKDGYVDWDYASLEDVRNNFQQAGLLDESVHLVKGKVEDTLQDARNIPGRIALLRLDTDWYESTKIELEMLYPKLAQGGVMIVDDYGHWQGARKAVDEYFRDKNVLLSRIDYTARLIIKN